MFVDASAIVAFLTGEPEADASADALDDSHSRITFPVAIFEATLGFRRKRHARFAEARRDVKEFFVTARVRTVPVAAAEAALDAFDRYGRGRGHPAQLNLGNCFAYGAARCHRACSKVAISARPKSAPRCSLACYKLNRSPRYTRRTSRFATTSPGVPSISTWPSCMM